MAHKILAVALSMIAAASPVSAGQPDPISTVAPPGTAETKYCMRVEAITGSRIETVQCWTREMWAEQGVDLDRDWAKEGVEVIA